MLDKRLFMASGTKRNIDGVDTYASCAELSHQDFDNEAIFCT